MSADQIAQIVDEVIKAQGATSQKQMGAVIKEVMAKTGGMADGKAISDLVRGKLQ
ncbi:MAG TPA: GatB/YqeY domain-containing protein [Bdellovibrionales bacterium]|nr:GatB/YqeY domain-containing protein [Bdellovibrionales bacterium]